MAFSQGIPSALAECWGETFEYEILAYYFNIHRIPCMINSPLRVDTNPSFQIFSSSHGKVRWIDYGTGEKGNLWLLLAKYWQIPIKEVEKRVTHDLSRIKSHGTKVEVVPTTLTKGKVTYSKHDDLQVKVREWRNYDLEYWGSQGISKEWLVFGDIYPISHIIIKKSFSSYTIPCDKFAYVFVEFKDSKTSFKVYQPFSKFHKWFSKHDRSVWDLWDKLPINGDNLIITSSRKDALCIWSNTGIPCTSLQGEGYLPKAHVMAELIGRFKNIYVLYDNDFRSQINYGHEYGKALASNFNLVQIEIPLSYHSKDPSDLYHTWGVEVLRKVIFSFIKQEHLIKEEDNTPF